MIRAVARIADGTWIARFGRRVDIRHLDEGLPGEVLGTSPAATLRGSPSFGKNLEGPPLPPPPGVRQFLGLSLSLLKPLSGPVSTKFVTEKPGSSSESSEMWYGVGVFVF